MSKLLKIGLVAALFCRGLCFVRTSEKDALFEGR